MEILLACAVLMDCDLLTEKEYRDCLDKLFLEMPNNNLLLELEWQSNHIKQSLISIRKYFGVHKIDSKTFGTFLLGKIKDIYQSKKMNINEFGSLTYLVWESLPSPVQDIEPFYTLAYADNPLSWGDENQTREIYESMLNFYDEKRGDSRYE